MSFDSFSSHRCHELPESIIRRPSVNGLQFSYVVRTMLKKFGPGSDYYAENSQLDLRRSLIKQERQTIRDSSLVQLPKSVPQGNETLFMTTQEKAKLRNDALLKSIDKLNRDIDEHLRKPDDPKFGMLKSNYWDMVNEVFPMWQRELNEYQERKRREKAANQPNV